MQQKPGVEFGARYIAPLIFVTWLLWLSVSPSLWLACAGLSWVIYFRLNRVAGQLVDAAVVLHKDGRAELAEAVALILRRPDPSNPEVMKAIDEMLDEAEKLRSEDATTSR
jgi:hypothetical protein